MIDFERLGRELLSRADELVPAWLAGGKRSGHEWVCGDLSGSPGRSLSVNLKTGAWSDFASETDKGGDLISLYAAIHGLDQLGAARELAGDDHQGGNGVAVPRETPRQPKAEEPAPEPLLPAPVDAGEPPEPRRGVLEARHEYRLPSGDLVGVIQRIRLTDGSKSFAQWRWSAAGEWVPRSMPEPRPLYGLQALAARPRDPVLIVEGERCADEAARVLPRYVVITWPGGSKAWKRANWQVLADRAQVDIWPDADEPGRKAAGGIALALFEAGIKHIRIVDPTGQPEGWDIADALSEGWTGDACLAWARERIRPFEAPKLDKPVKKDGPEIPQRGLIQGTDMAFARRFHARHGAHLRFIMERGWAIWNGQRWREDPKEVLVSALAKESSESLLDEVREAPDRNEAFKTAKVALQKRSIQSLIWLARSEPGVPAKISQFDSEPMILNVANGMVDLTTGKLLPHDKGAMCSLIAGTHHDPEAQCSRWRQFIGEIMREDVQLMDYLQALCGYLLTGATTEHCLAFLHGATGRNGKSRFIETMRAVLGEYAVVSSPEIIMSRNYGGIPNDIARLRGARAVFMNETKRGSRFDEQKLKDLTGGDTLNARFLREEFFDFEPTHKLVIRGNHKPAVSGNDPALWSRIKLVPFEVNFELEGTMDKLLDAKLRAELPGILNWCIEGCLRWQREGLPLPQRMLDAVAAYRGETDTIAKFIHECCVLDADSSTKAAALYTRYRDYCAAASERWLSYREFPEEMTARGVKINGHDYQGISLNRASEWGARRAYGDEGEQSGFW